MNDGIFIEKIKREYKHIIYLIEDDYVDSNVDRRNGVMRKSNTYSSM